jgi:hypothetical protein
LTAGVTASPHLFISTPNPLKYTDPDGREIAFELENGATDEDKQKAEQFAAAIENSNTDAGEMYRALKDSDKLIKIKVKASGYSAAYPGDDEEPGLLEKLKSAFVGGNAMISFNPNGNNAESTLAHEIGHAYGMAKGFNQWTRRGRETYAMAVENQYRALQQPQKIQINTYIGETFNKRPKSLEFKNMPLYDTKTGQYYREGFFGNKPYTLYK